MRIEELANNMVYTEGSSFWIVTEKAHSSWSNKLDWYINFLITRVSKVNKQSLSEDLKKIIHEEEIILPNITSVKSPALYIPTKQFLPNQALMLVPYQNDLEAWLKAIKEIWLKLKQPSLRIFLPKDSDKNKFIRFCQEELPADITFVCES